jgi:leader peptidase (prepilin peptidase) / N-methyltransferase
VDFGGFWRSITAGMMQLASTTTNLNWAIALLVLVVHVLWISWTDWVHLIIPNLANLSLGAAGLLWTILVGQSVVWEAVEIVCGGGMLWLIAGLYHGLRGHHGLGLGDVKFVGAATAWTGLIGLPWLLLIASMSALTWVVAKHMGGRSLVQGQRIAFGPHLGLGLLATWLAKSHDMI